MIKINQLSGLGFAKRPVFKGGEKQAGEEKPVSSNELKGAEALAIYNRPAIKSKKPEPLELISDLTQTPETVKGEKIYSSDGKLVWIVDTKPEGKTIYNIEDDKIDSIVVKDNNNKIVKRQDYFYDDDKNIDGASVREFSLKTGQLIKSTNFDKNGEANYIGQYEYRKDDITVRRGYNLDENRQYIEIEGKHKDFYASIDRKDDNEVFEMVDNVEDKFKSRRREVRFFNGTMISYEESKKYTMPSLIGSKYVNNPNLEPGKIMTKEQIKNLAEGYNGEATYYSNGIMESKTVNTPEGEYKISFMPDGEVTKITSDKTEIEYDDDRIYVTEHLNDNETRETIYYNDNSYEVSYKNGDESKTVVMNKTGKPRYYFDENTAKDSELNLSFNELGVIEDAHIW